MDSKSADDSNPIKFKFTGESKVITITLTQEGVDYLYYILGKLKDKEIEDGHWHIGNYDGWVGGDVKHLIIEKLDP